MILGLKERYGDVKFGVVFFFFYFMCCYLRVKKIEVVLDEKWVVICNLWCMIIIIVDFCLFVKVVLFFDNCYVFNISFDILMI